MTKMCYALTNELYDEHAGMEDLYSQDAEPAAGKSSNGQADASSNKRRASSPLEHEPAKAAKVSNNISSSHDSENGDGDQAGSESEAVEGEQAGSRGEDWEAEVKRLRSFMLEVGDERDKYRLKAIEYEAANEELEAKLHRAKANKDGVGMELSKRLEKEIQAKYQDKINGLKEKWKKFDNEKVAKHQQEVEALQKKHENQQKLKDLACNKKIEEAKDRAEKQVTEMKKKLDDAKENHKTAQDDLKMKHKKELSSYKPEHSNAVKEKDKALKEKIKKIEELEKSAKEREARVRTFENKVGELDCENGDLKALLRTKANELSDLETKFYTKCEEIDNMKKKWIEAKAALEAKLAHEGRKWRQQHNIAKEAELKFISTVRGNTLARQIQERQRKQIVELEAELKRGKDIDALFEEASEKADVAETHAPSEEASRKAVAAEAMSADLVKDVVKDVMQAVTGPTLDMGTQAGTVENAAVDGAER
ncbi:hypothetical protein LTR37_016377 [Vermiconidia calcicola]|uniref:Uncharacterized protein n=1 Tax=Vermiconidia calcicola TaxID=1690605 RepID=A0ACC3MMY0_9PEZI|nr:hypothetical protein LTR37_016377 [Vermiconidia calcicola]